MAPYGNGQAYQEDASRESGIAERTHDEISRETLEKASLSRQNFVPVAAFLAFAFIVVFSSAFILACKKHTAAALGKHGFGEANKVPIRRLAVYDLHYARKTGDAFPHRLPHARSLLSGFPSRARPDTGVTDVGAAVEQPPPLSDGVLAWRRLSEGTSDSSHPPSDRGQRSGQGERPFQDLCEEASSGGGSIFLQLLDLQEAVEGQGTFSFVGEQEVSKTQPESQRVIVEEGITASIGGPRPETPAALTHVTVSTLMDPGVSPSAILEDASLVPELWISGGERSSAPLWSEFNVAPVIGAVDAGASATASPRRSLVSDLEFTELADDHYEKLLSLWHSAVGGLGSVNFARSERGAKERRSRPAESRHAADESKGASESRSAGQGNGCSSPSKSTAQREHGTSKQSPTTRGLPLPKAVLDPDDSFFYSHVIPWDAATLSFGGCGRRPYTKRSVVELRSILSNAKISGSQGLRALFLGKQILEEVYPYPYKSCGVWEVSYKTVASLLVHTMIRLDTLLWLGELFPRITSINAWWARLVDYCKIRNALDDKKQFQSKYKWIIQPCLECLRHLADRSRPPRGDVEMIMSAFELHLSRAKNAKAKGYSTDDVESGAAEHVGLLHASGNVHSDGQGSLVTQNQGGWRVMASSQSDNALGKNEAALREGLASASESYVSQDPSQESVTSRILSLMNVPRVRTPISEEGRVGQAHRWNIKKQDIGAFYNARNAIQFPLKASSILAKRDISCEERSDLLILGVKIVRCLRPITRSHPLDRSWRERTRAKTMSLYVIQLDTLLRISNMFPEETERHSWWPEMVEKCNIMMVLQSSVSETSRYYNVVEASRKALGLLVQQARPEARNLAFVYEYYEKVLKGGN